MATAKKVALDLYEVNLTLSEKEAIDLMSVLNHIVGPDEGPRGNISAIWRSLHDIGIRGPRIIARPSTVSSSNLWVENG